jgi:hypothetical protein
MAKRIVVALLVLSGVVTLHDQVVLHPYQYIYFNHLIAGGVERSAQRFETDYWGQSHWEAMKWIFSHVKGSPGPPVRISSCMNTAATGTMIRDLPEGKGFQAVDYGDPADLEIVLNRAMCHRTPGDEVLHVIDRQGAPLLWIVRPPAVMR